MIGRRERSVINADGSLQCYLIRRLKCPECGHIHHELPDFMVPYKRYAAPVIEAAIEGDVNRIPCYDSTIASFKRWFVSIADKMANLLEEMYPTEKRTQEVVSPLQRIKALYGDSAGWLAWAVGLVVNSNQWLKTRLLC